MGAKVENASFTFFIPMRTIIVKYMRNLTFPIIIERDKDGFYAECPALEGCSSQGSTYREALHNIKEAVQLYLEYLEAGHKKIPQPKMLVGLPTIEVVL